MSEETYPGLGRSSVETITREQFNARVEWVRILRTKKYKQTYGRLASPKGHRRCCLGVACDERVTPGMSTDVVTVDTVMRNGVPTLSFDQEWGVLPLAAKLALGFKDSNPEVTRVTVNSESSVAALNDHDHLSFEQIADVIEDEYVTPYYVEGIFDEGGS